VAARRGAGERARRRPRELSRVFHRFPWSIFATDALLSDLEARFGPAPSGGRDHLRRMLPRLFQHVGGLPVTEVLHDEAERTAAARRMLVEAGRRAARDALRRDAGPGFVVAASTAPALAEAIEAVGRVAVNRATRAELIALPVIEHGLADAIIADRMNHGPFRDADDLVRRIRGIGTTNIRALRPYLDFSLSAPGLAVSLTGAFDHDWPALVGALAGGAD